MTTILRGQMIRFAGDPFQDDAALIHDADGALVIQDGLIADVGPAEVVLARHADRDFAQVTGLIAPGFVDAHAHYPQIGIIASWGADLIDWLERYTFPEEARFSDPDHAEAAASAYFDAQLGHGVTTAASFLHHPPGLGRRVFHGGGKAWPACCRR